MRPLSLRRFLVLAVPVAAVVGVTTHSQAQDQGSQCDLAAAVTDMNSAPLANDDEAWVAPGSAVRIDVAGNDHDFDGDDLVVASVSPPSAGTATLEDGLVAFVAPATEGPVSMRYEISDGACGTDVANVRVVVSNSDVPAGRAVPAAPVPAVPAYAG